MRTWLIQRVVGYSDIRVWIVGDHDTGYGRYLWGELGGPLARLRKFLSVVSPPPTVWMRKRNILYVRLCSFSVFSAGRNRIRGSSVPLGGVKAPRQEESSGVAGPASLSSS